MDRIMLRTREQLRNEFLKLAVEELRLWTGWDWIC